MARTHEGGRPPENDLGTGAIEAIMIEIDTTSETADRVAREGVAEGADPISVLAGLISQLSEQVGRLSRQISGSQPARTRLTGDDEEEDVSPGIAPAEPRRGLDDEAVDPAR
jgi:hypothetical protein